MIAPTVVVAGVVVALWASIVGRVWLTLSATLVACLAGSWGYVTTSGEPLIVSIPASLLGSVAAVVGIAWLIVACNRGEAR